MRLSRIAPKKFSTRLIVMVLISGLIPILTAIIAIDIFLHQFPAEIDRSIDLGQKEQWQRDETVLTKMAEDFIRRKAMDVALQIELYLEVHPEMMLEALQINPEFREIAIQPVGKTGYTVLQDMDIAINRFHNDPKIENSDLHLLSRSLPEFWAIIEAGMGGRYSQGFYQWRDLDGNRRDKFMYIAPVGRKTADGVRFGVAATTYIDEFTSPMRIAQDVSRITTRTLIGTLTKRIETFRNMGVLLSCLGVLFVLSFSLWVGTCFSRAIIQFRDATKAVNEGDFSIKLKPAMSGDVGELIEDFNDMVAQLAETTVKKEALEKSEGELKRANILLEREITGHKQAVDDLGKSEVKYRTVFENTGTATIIIEEDTISLANTEFENLSGYSREEVEGKMRWTDFIDEKDIERMQEYHKGRREKGEGRKEKGEAAPTEYEFRFVDRQGDIRDILLRVAVISGTERSVCSLMDITNLRESLEEKEILLKEIHHRVKNNMQIISSLLSLQSEHIEDKDALEMLRESESRIRSMASVHAIMYQSEDLTLIDFTDYTQRVARQLIAVYSIDPDVVKMNIDCSDVSLGIDEAVPCGLIINELLSNALKHAFPGGKGGEITVDFYPDGDDGMTLVVSDNGIGLPEEINIKEAKTLGLQLVAGLVDQLDGTLEIEREVGTTFRITHI